MRISKIQLENIKSYGEDSQPIVFSNTLNVITGLNEAGKTTILEAIGFLLFNTLPGKTHADFIKYGADTGKISLTVIAKDDREYELFRSIGKSKKMYIRDVETDEKLPIHDPGEVNTWIKDNFNFSTNVNLKTLFEQIIGVPQGSMVSSFLETPTVRKTKFDPILHVDDYKGIFKYSKELLNTLNEEIHKKELKLERFETKVEELPEYEKKASQLKIKLKTRTSEFELLNRSIPQLEQNVKHYSELKENIDTQTTKISGLAQRISDKQSLQIKLESDVAKAQKAQEVIKKTKVSFEKYKTLTKDKEQIEHGLKTKAEHEKKLNQLTIEKTEAETILKTLNEKLRDIKEKEQRFMELRPQIQQQIEIEKQIEAIDESLAQIKLLERQLGSYQKQTQTLHKNINQVTSKLGEINKLEFKPEILEQNEKTREYILKKIAILENNIKREKEFMALSDDGLCPFFKKTCPLSDEPLTSVFKANENDFILQLNVENDKKIAIQKEIAKLEKFKKIFDQKEKFQAELDSFTQQLTEVEKNIADSEKKIMNKAILDKKRDEKENEIKKLDYPVKKEIVLKKVIEQKPGVKKEISSIMNDISSLSSKIVTNETELRKYTDMEDKLTSINKTMQTIQPMYEEYIKNISTAQKLTDLQKSLTSLNIELKKLNKDLEMGRKELDEMKKSYNKEKHITYEKNLKNSTNRRISLNTDLRNIKRELYEKEKKIKELKEFAKQVTQLKKEIHQDRNLESFIEFIRNIYNNAGPNIVSYFIKKISADATRYFQILTNDDTKFLEITNDYDIILRTQTEERAFKLFSGGQQISAVLAVRLGFIQNLSEVEFAFFDEPTQNLDEERRVNLAEALNKIPSMQLVVISHDDTFEQSCDHVIKIEKDNILGSRVA